MIVYWLLFSVFALGAPFDGRQKSQDSTASLPLAVGALLIALLIGFRYQVGGDWVQYERLFFFAKYSNVGRMLSIGDPGYQFINWAFAHASFDFWAVNLFCGAVFSSGLYRFASTQPNPSLAVLVAIPYLIIVVAMGYARQAVAIGIILGGLASLLRGSSVAKFACYVAVAALFHKTAVVALPLITLVAGRNKWFGALLVLASSVLLYEAFLSNAQDGFLKSYVEARYNSQGAAVRVAMIILPALMFFTSGKKMGFSRLEYTLWRNFSFASFILLFLLLVLPSSTVVDRLALYVLPLQIAIIPRIWAFGLRRSFSLGLTLIYAFFVQFVWLNYAVYADHWIPYQFFPVTN